MVRSEFQGISILRQKWVCCLLGRGTGAVTRSNPAEQARRHIGKGVFRADMAFDPTKPKRFGEAVLSEDGSRAGRWTEGVKSSSLWGGGSTVSVPYIRLHIGSRIGRNE